MTERSFGGSRNVPESDTERQRRLALSEVEALKLEGMPDIESLTSEEQQRAFGRNEAVENTDLVDTQDVAAELVLPEADEKSGDE